MGDTRFEGGFEIEPPLTYADLKRKPPALGRKLDPGNLIELDASLIFPLKLNVVAETMDRTDGVLTVYSASSVLPVNENDYIRHGRTGGLRYMEILGELFPDRKFTGYVEGVDSDAGELFRIVQGKDGFFQIITPELVWPEV